MIPKSSNFPPSWLLKKRDFWEDNVWRMQNDCLLLSFMVMSNVSINIFSFDFIVQSESPPYARYDGKAPTISNDCTTNRTFFSHSGGKKASHNSILKLTVVKYMIFHCDHNLFSVNCEMATHRKNQGKNIWPLASCLGHALCWLRGGGGSSSALGVMGEIHHVSTNVASSICIWHMCVSLWSLLFLVYPSISKYIPWWKLYIRLCHR